MHATLNSKTPYEATPTSFPGYAVLVADTLLVRPACMQSLTQTEPEELHPEPCWQQRTHLPWALHTTLLAAVMTGPALQLADQNVNLDGACLTPAWPIACGCGGWRAWVLLLKHAG